MMAMVMMMMMI